MKYPDKDRILKVLNMINNKQFIPVKIPAIDAPAPDLIKFNICQKIIKFKMDSGFTNKELANILGVTPAMITRIIHCEINKFKIDSLLYYYESLLITKKNKKILAKFKKSLVNFLKDDFEAA
jgi:hypothetical protein